MHVMRTRKAPIALYVWEIKKSLSAFIQNAPKEASSPVQLNIFYLKQDFWTNLIEFQTDDEDRLGQSDWISIVM